MLYETFGSDMPDDSIGLNEQDQCAICFTEMHDHDSHVLDECGHRFHTACVVTWFRSKHETCPLCRKLPSVTMKIPDVLHRAKQLISLCEQGHTHDIFLKEKIKEMKNITCMESILQLRIQDAHKNFKDCIMPHKKQLLAQFRHERKIFKEKTNPLLEIMDQLDKNDRETKNDLHNQLTIQKKLKKAIMRDIGLYDRNLNLQSSSLVASNQQNDL